MLIDEGGEGSRVESRVRLIGPMREENGRDNVVA